MSDTVTVEELDAQIELRKNRFKQVTAEIRAVLREDIALFVPREVKKAFLASPSAAQAMTKAKVAELKEKSSALAAALAAKVDAALSDDAVWTTSAEVPKNKNDISAQTAVWERVQPVETDLQALLDTFGLGSDPVRYKAPAYFVKGLYLPSLAEHYWRLVQEVQELEGQKTQIVDDATRAELESKWDDA